MTIESQEGNNSSKNIGKDSIAAALHRSSVTNIQWCLSIIGKIFDALCFALSSPFASISKASLSIDANPTVRPDISPPNNVATIASPANNIAEEVVKSALLNSTGSSCETYVQIN